MNYHYYYAVLMERVKEEQRVQCDTRRWIYEDVLRQPRRTLFHQQSSFGLVLRLFLSREETHKRSD